MTTGSRSSSGADSVPSAGRPASAGRCYGHAIVARSVGTCDGVQAAAVGCRAHTGWAVLVAVAGKVEQPRVLCRWRAELSDPAGQVRRNVYQANRRLEPAVVAPLVDAAKRIAAEQAAAAFERALRQATAEGVALRRCAVIVGMLPAGAQLESVLASHALAHAAEGRLYQDGLLQGAEASGLEPFAVPKRSIWELGESALGIPARELRNRIDHVRQEIGPPWAQDQKLAALAAWISLAQP
jgi:hypothetical protein